MYLSPAFRQSIKEKPFSLAHTPARKVKKCVWKVTQSYCVFSHNSATIATKCSVRAVYKIPKPCLILFQNSLRLVNINHRHFDDDFFLANQNLF